MKRTILLFVVACMASPLFGKEMMPDGEKSKMPGGKNIFEIMEMLVKEKGLLPPINILKKSNELPQFQFPADLAPVWDKAVDELNTYPAKLKALDTDGKIAYLGRQGDRIRKNLVERQRKLSDLNKNLMQTSEKYKSTITQIDNLKAKIEPLEKQLGPLFDQVMSLNENLDKIRRASPKYREIEAMEKEEEDLWDDNSKVSYQIKDKLQKQVKPIQTEFYEKLSAIINKVMPQVKLVETKAVEVAPVMQGKPSPVKPGSPGKPLPTPSITEATVAK